MDEHEFTPEIRRILADEFGDDVVDDLLQRSELLQYLNIKTRAASRGSKSRASFGNHYALYVLVEDYVGHGFHTRDGYSEYEGAQFSKLFARQRELPFGSRLQNHALNHRLNQEFSKYFPQCDLPPIVRDAATNRYWVNEGLLRVRRGGDDYQLAPAIIRIIDAYVAARRGAFEEFMEDCTALSQVSADDPGRARDFLNGLLRPNVDARIFEIVSFCILRPFYASQTVFWGWSEDDLVAEPLTLYKTGRTNANDGGIDFVMRPLGRFFQVTETTDVKKYFLELGRTTLSPGPSPRSHRTCSFPASGEPVKDPIRGTQSSAS